MSEWKQFVVTLDGAAYEIDAKVDDLCGGWLAKCGIRSHQMAGGGAWYDASDGGWSQDVDPTLKRAIEQKLGVFVP